MRTKGLIIALISLSIWYVSDIRAMFPINYFRSWDENIVKPYRSKDARVDVACTPEFGLKVFGRTTFDMGCEPPDGGPEVNVLRIWQEEQDALAMLKGFNPSSQIGSLAQQLNIDDDNGIRGHFLFCGDLDLKANVIFSSKFYLPHNFSAGIYVPFVSLKLSTRYEDLTQNVTEEDILTKELLTNNFAANVAALGNGLNINGWKKEGLGDISLIVDWAQNFPQAKPLLKNVRLRMRAGAVLPTGKPQDPDEIMSIPLGNDHSFGVIFGPGLDLSISRWVNLGIDVQFLFQFANVRERRIKTDIAQTELLLLAKTKVLKDFGFTQLFNLYAELFKIGNRLTFNFTYQFWRHDDDRVAVLGNTYSSIPANTAKSLEEWTIHNFIYKINYDLEDDLPDNAPVKPYLSLFYKQPINGKNAVLAHTMGFIASFTF